MQRSLRRGRAFRLPLRLPLATHVLVTPASCRARYSSTLSPPTIATLLGHSESPLQSRQPPLSGETLTLNGFVRSVRKQKRVAFAAIGDGSSLQTVQAVLTPEQAEGLVPHSAS
jgi:asparaginyl-tRNA synthetase